MKRITTTLLSALVALTVIAASAATPAQAGSKERRIIAGILLGAIGGAIIANEVNRSKKKRHKAHRPNSRRIHDNDIYVEPRNHRRVRHNSRRTSWERHVRRCARKYRSYDEYSDTWIDRRGRERICRL